MTIRAISLQSGSNGNCTYVESRGTRLLFDAGISGDCASRRLARYGIDISAVDALFISHDHADHVRGAGVFQRKFGMPVYATAKTLAAAKARCNLGRIDDVRPLPASGEVVIGALAVRTLRTPHDGADGVAFVVSAGSRRLGILTDLGHVFAGLAELVASLDAVFIESNYNPEMLAAGPYPQFLKERIKGPRGHLSNSESAGLIASAGGRLKWACLAHLSENNNDPSLALEAHMSVIQGAVPLHVAGRYASAGVFEV